MDILKLKNIRDNFVTELTLASIHETSSLPYIKQQMPQTSRIIDDEIFQTIVIGGSVYKKGMFQKKGNKVKHLKIEVGDAKRFGNIDIFLDFIASLTDPNVTNIALNFAYPMTPILRDDKIDGVLINGSKENEFIGLIGKAVGDEIEKYFINKSNRQLNVSCANDAICLLLSSKERFNKHSSVGGIVGTGINFAFFENDNLAINIEAANFNKFVTSFETRKIDEQSIHPGLALFEKEVAGAYLYKHFNHKLKELNINYNPITSSKELSLLCYKDIPDVSKLAQRIVMQSAHSCAAMIAGLARYKKTDIDIIMEGSLFWKGYRYTSEVDQAIKLIEHEYEVNFIQIENSDTYGGANLLLI